MAWSSTVIDSSFLKSSAQLKVNADRSLSHTAACIDAGHALLTRRDWQIADPVTCFPVEDPEGLPPA